MVRFSLLPYQSFNDEEDLTNEEFLNRIQEPIDGEMIAVSIILSIGNFAAKIWSYYMSLGSILSRKW